MTPIPQPEGCGYELRINWDYKSLCAFPDLCGWWFLSPLEESKNFFSESSGDEDKRMTVEEAESSGVLWEFWPFGKRWKWDPFFPP